MSVLTTALDTPTHPIPAGQHQMIGGISGCVCVCLDVEQMCTLVHTRAWVRMCRCGCACMPLSAPPKMHSVCDVRGGSQPVNYMWPVSRREVVWGGRRGGACAAVSRNPSLT